MKLFFLMMLVFSGVSLVLFSVLAVKLKNTLTSSFVLLNILAVFVITMYALTLFPFKMEAGLFFAGVFFAGLDWLLYCFFRFVMVFTQEKKSRYLPFIRFFYITVSFVDTVSMVLNTFFRHAFTITPDIDSDGKFFCWIYKFNLAYDIHLVFCYLIVAHLMIYLVHRSLVSPKFYRIKYFQILFAFAFLIGLNGIFILLDWKIDVSVIIYVYMDIFLFMLAFYSIPMHIERNMRFIVASQMEGCIVCYDDDGGIFYMNSKARHVLESRADIRDKVSEFQNQFVISYGKASNYCSWQCELGNEGKNEIWSFDFNALSDEKGKIIGSALKFEDCTDEFRRVRLQQYNATHDLLTGLLNRQSFFETAHEILIENPFERFILCATDIENFKLVNDLFGKELGDKILKTQAAVLSMNVFPKCIKGRISGDKFAFLMPEELFNPRAIEKNLNRIQNEIKDVDYRIKMYLGVYEVEDHYGSVQDMFDKAVLAISRIRGNYTKTVSYYDSSIMEELVYRQNILNDFRPSLSAGDFCIFLQSQFNTDKKIIGCEALVRWNHMDKGLLSPSQFVKPLEESGLIWMLDDYMWESAARLLSQWQRNGIDFYISVNISPKDFYYTDVLKRFRELIQKYEFNPSKLNVEITETEFINTGLMYASVINGLKSLGICIELDDFGSGYSSFKTLEDFEFDVLKIDMEFLRECENEEKAHSIISSVITMAKELGIKVVTEGVEEESQFNYLKEAGADIFQGYYFSKPLSFMEFENTYVHKGREVKA